MTYASHVQGGVPGLIQSYGNATRLALEASSILKCKDWYIN